MFGNEYKGILNVTAYEGKISRIQTELYEIKFYNRHIVVSFKLLNFEVLKEYVYIDIEHKVYHDSPHSLKIYYSREENKDKVLQFIAELMGAEKPIRRFSLANFKKSTPAARTEKDIVSKALA